jgi:hypothetical protein
MVIEHGWWKEDTIAAPIADTFDRSRFARDRALRLSIRPSLNQFHPRSQGAVSGRAVLQSGYLGCFRRG